MLPYRDSKITKTVLVVFFLLVVGYAYFEAQGFLFGPSISVSSKVTEVHEPFITIQGRADRIASLSMNGKQITVTEDGSFSAPYLLAEGDNRIVLDASDKYGRSRRQVIEIVYTPLPGAIQTTATSTESASTSPAVAH
jgi:hypothetical protein